MEDAIIVAVIHQDPMSVPAIKDLTCSWMEKLAEHRTCVPLELIIAHKCVIVLMVDSTAHVILDTLSAMTMLHA
jgi:hypothetical protein